VNETSEIVISKKILKTPAKDAAKMAKAMHLQYVNDQQPGISRKRNGDGFDYFEAGKRINNKETLARIKKLVIPPAWENVWICQHENGHLQVTGIDKLGRKQYRYHPAWSQVRNLTKFFRMLDFGQQLPKIRETIQANLNLKGLPKEKVLALVVSLLQETNIRIGNQAYEKLYGSFGLTTMKNKHVKIDGTKLVFSFKGKKGVKHNIGLKNRKLANIIKSCSDLPGKELFEFINENGEVQTIDSGMVNEFIRTIAEGEFSAKDFRTWSGSVRAIAALKEMGDYETISELNKKIPAVFDTVAGHLGNTRTVCKKYYVHPVIIDLYEKKKLDSYFELNTTETNPLLSEEEHILLNILQKQ
jgi:DNA topoisomerase-1